MHTLHAMNFNAHVADFRAALADHPSDYPRAALSCLPQDGLAQVLSYLDCAPVLLTLSAVSPQARLDAETLCEDSDHDQSSPAYCRCQVVEEHKLMFKISSQYREVKLPRLRTKLWWAERCGLPLALQDDNAYRFVLAKLNDTLRSRVEHVVVEPETAKKCLRNSEAAKLLCDGRCGSALCALKVVPNLSSLSLKGDWTFPSLQLPSWLPSRLSITTLKVSEVQLQNDAAFFVGWVSLRSVSLQECGIQSVDAFASMQSLVELDVSYNENIATVSPLSNAPSLQKLCVCCCNLRNVDGLGTCARLRVIDVSENKSLVNLDGLSGARNLQTLIAASCCLQSLDALHACRRLKWIDAFGNENLESLSGLSDATELQTLNAASCGLRSLDAVRTCRRLKEIDVSQNPHLTSLNGVAEATELQTLKAASCGLQSLDALHTCMCLKEIDVSGNNLESLNGLSSAANLVEMKAANCNLFNIDALKALPLLEVVDVSKNRALQSLLPLAGAPHLRKLSAKNCDIRSVEGLGRCPKLAVIDLTGNENLTDISKLAAAPLLEYVNATRTGVFTRAAGFPSGKIFVKPFDKKEGTPNHLISYGGRMRVRGMHFGDRWELALSSDADSSERYDDE